MTATSDNEAVAAAIGTLANTMRLYVESHMRFGDLILIDREEAIDNLDRAFDAKLEAFHSLYDVSKHLFPYFDHGDTSLLIAVRNAIHHRNHPLFRSFYAALFIDDGVTQWAGASFLMASHPTLHGAPTLMKHFVKLADIDARLNPALASPYLETMLKGRRAEQRVALIEKELAFAEIRKEASRERYPEKQIYLNLMPIFMSAVIKVFTAMKAAGVTFRGFDAITYLRPFTTELAIDLKNPVFKVERLG